MLEYLKGWLPVITQLGWMNIAIFLLAFVFFSVVSVVVVSAILVWLPSTYFCDSHPRDLWTDKHPVIRWIGLILKNLFGIFLVILGGVLAMPGVPGPGLFTIIIGVLLLDFPGKRRVERRLIALPTVFSAINRLRLKHGKAPLVLDTPGCDKAPSVVERMKQESE
jgi:hypothetical protein